MICNFPSCSVCQCEEHEVPLPWKQESKKREEINIQIEDKFKKWTDKFNTSNSQWILDSEVDSQDGTYVNLLNNPESYTGYQGQNIWKAIFSENCFSDNLNNICTEEKVFYKIFSGLLANINIHISSNYFDNVRNYSYVNITMINERVANHGERVENLVFLYSLMVKAFNKAEEFFFNYKEQINTGNSTEDQFAVSKINELYNLEEFKDLASICKQYDEEVHKFLNFHNINNLITRFRNVSSIMDCVSCQKCKLHGKLQVYGLATMLKILSNDNIKVSRNEIIAFVNLFGKLSRSLYYLKRINENINHSQFFMLIKLGFICLCYFLVFLYVNFYLFRKRPQINSKEKKL